MTSRNRLYPISQPSSAFLASKTEFSNHHDPDSQHDVDESSGRVPTLQELIGDMIRNQVAEERKDVFRKHSSIFDTRRCSLEAKREELQRQLREVEDQIKSVEIECHEDMLEELDEFDNERQPEMLDILTDIGQPDRICPLCEKFFRSSTELPKCCLGPEHCHLHMVQRCCFMCSRLNFHDIFQCLVVTESENNGKLRTAEEDNGGMRSAGGDGDTIENTAVPPSWMMDELLEEPSATIFEENEDEYQETAANLAMAALQLVPSDSGSVKCPVCHDQYCDHDFLYHFAACCRQAQKDEQSEIIYLQSNE